MITVASVPTAHRYVEHLDAPGKPSVVRVPDPRPVDLDSDAGDKADADRWWPPRWLEPAWLEAHIDTVDLLHVHFGFDSIPPDQLREVVRALHSADKPLVLTVHDLHNPHFVDNTVHLQQLDVLVPCADEVVTLTRGAAEVIERRWGTSPTVVPHPHVAPLERLGRTKNTSDDFVIGVHAKSLRANLDPLAVMDTIVAAAAQCPGARVQLDIDDNLFDSPHKQQAGAALLAYGPRDGVDVRVHPRFDDDELWQYMADLDVSVLPYRFGTHSGWLEACHDLGTAVIVPDCGYFADQKPSYSYGFGVGRFDPESLTAAVRDAYAARADIWAASRDDREKERAVIAELHDWIYARALRARSHPSEKAGTTS